MRKERELVAGAEAGLEGVPGRTDAEGQKHGQKSNRKVRRATWRGHSGREVAKLEAS